MDLRRERWCSVYSYNDFADMIENIKQFFKSQSRNGYRKIFVLYAHEFYDRMLNSMFRVTGSLKSRISYGRY